MKCLSNGDEINAIIGKTGPFSRKYFVLNVVSMLASLAITCSKYSERITAAWPLPVAQSQARFLCCMSPTRNSNSDLGYLGLELAYSFELLEKWSLNFVSFKLA